MPSYRLLAGVHMQRGMEAWPAGSGKGDYDGCRSVAYEVGDTFWSITPLTDTTRYEPVASTYRYGVDDAGMSVWYPAALYGYATNVLGLDLSPLTGSSPQKDIADAIAALVDA